MNNLDQKRLSFYKKRIVIIPIFFFLLLVGLCIALFLTTENFPVYFLVLLLVVITLGLTELALIFLFHGISITKKGNIIFCKEYYVRIFKRSDVQSIAIAFDEWPNGRFSYRIAVNLVNGKTFSWNYAREFTRLNNGDFRLFTARQVAVMEGRTFSKEKVTEFTNSVIDERLFDIVIYNSNRQEIFSRRANESTVLEFVTQEVQQ